MVVMVKNKSIKKCVIKQEIKCKDYRNWQEASQTENEMKYLEKINFKMDKPK